MELKIHTPVHFVWNIETLQANISIPYYAQSAFCVSKHSQSLAREASKLFVTLPVYCFRLPSYAYLLFQAPT
jgi:hypothetical protein